MQSCRTLSWLRNFSVIFDKNNASDTCRWALRQLSFMPDTHPVLVRYLTDSDRHMDRLTVTAAFSCKVQLNFKKCQIHYNVKGKKAADIYICHFKWWDFSSKTIKLSKQKVCQLVVWWSPCPYFSVSSITRQHAFQRNMRCEWNYIFEIMANHWRSTQTLFLWHEETFVTEDSIIPSAIPFNYYQKWTILKIINTKHQRFIIWQVL